MPEFPHLKDPRFPNVGNVDVYKYQNDFDYGRYDNAQMRIQICAVPWDMGEAHIGNRTISGIGNVVWFETEENRDAWFDAIPDTDCFRFETKYKQLHRDNEIFVPVPFDVASLYNYLVVDYAPFAAQDDLIDYETPNGLRKWFWFIREVEFVAPNTTKLHLLNDAFQTFMYRMHFSGMILERGHAPLFATTTDKYLANPRENNVGLLAEDVNFGEAPTVVTDTRSHVFNYDVLACIVTSANPTSAWGSKDNGNWKTPALASYAVNGVPSYMVFAMGVSSLNGFLTTIDNDIPQFKQSVKGVFFAPSELLALGATFTFAGVTCRYVSTSNKVIDFVDIDKSLFGYPTQYADLAKLYTWPYACFSVTDENGNSDIVKIEDTAGSLDISAAMSLAYPAIQIQAHLLGNGGPQSTLSFTNITAKSLRIGGRWYETLHSWDVPLFGIVQSGAKRYDYSTYYDREQQETALGNAYSSALASADTARDNAYASADTVTANAALQTTANSAMTAAGNTMASADTQTGQTLNTNTTNNAITYTNTSANNTIELKDATAAASQASNAISAAASAGASIASGNIAGAITSVASGIGQAAVINATNEAGVNYTAAQAAASNTNNRFNAIDTNVAAAETNQHAITAANSRLAASNALTSGAAANNAATIKGNADRTRTTDRANAGRTRDTARSAITNGINQGAMDAPQEFGLVANTAQATTKPIALVCNAMTQSANAIAMAADEFLRYGYYYGRQWIFDGNWNVGRHFTYWKLKDIWVKGLNIPDMYVDKLRFFLFGGVTVWRRPEDIGQVTIYDNWID